MFLILAVILLAPAGSASAATMQDTSRVTLSVARAVEHVELSEYREALSILDSLGASDSSGAVNYYRGLCCFHMGDYRECIRSLGSVNAGDSLYSLASFYLAATMLALNMPGPAIAYLEESLVHDSSYAPARLEYIRTLCAVDSFALAEKFVRRNENDNEALALAGSLVKGGNYDDAYPFIALVLSRDSTNALAHILLGETYFKTQKYSYALRVYDWLHSRFGESPFVSKRLAICLGNIGGRDNLEKAIDEMSRCLAVSRDTSTEDLEHIGAWYFRIGSYDSAETWFRIAVASNVSDPQARLNLGLTYMKLERYGEAVKSISLAYAFSKNSMGMSLSILKSLAAAQLKTNEYLRAAKNYGLVLELAPNDAEAMYGLAVAYDQSKDTSRAVHWYRKFVAIEKETGLNEEFGKYAASRIDSLDVSRKK